MELHVEAAGIANRLTLSVTAPQCGGGSLTVGTGEAYPAGGRLQHRKEVFVSSRAKPDSPLGVPWASLSTISGYLDYL